jgi:hypothetical protein
MESPEPGVILYTKSVDSLTMAEPAPAVLLEEAEEQQKILTIIQ